MHKFTLLIFSTLAALTLGAATVHADRGTDNQHGPGTAANNISNVTTVGQGFISSGTSASDAATGRSTAEFEVTPGNLTLDHVPNLKLEDAKVADIINKDVTVNYVNNAVTSTKNFDGNKDGALSVADYTGTNNGWNLMTALGQFKNTKTSAVIDNAKLVLTATNTTSESKVAAPLTSTLTATAANDSGTATQETNLWSAAKGTGQGSNTALYTDANSAKLTIAKQSNIAPGIYQATLYWNLVNVPTATPAKA